MHTPTRHAPGSLLRGDLPAQRGPAEEPLVRSVQHRTFTTVRIDAQLKVQTLPAQHPEWRTGFAGRSRSLRGFGSAYFTPSSFARAPRRTLPIA